MHTSILLANVGNRNIRYSGYTLAEWIAKLPKADRPTVLALSQELGAHFEVEKPKLTSQIVDAVLAKFQKKGRPIEKVYLFASNQQDLPQEVRDQDTLYIAQIQQKLLAETFPDTQFEVKEITCEAVSDEALLAFYWKFVSEVYLANPNANFLLLNNGGTPQQKSNLKIAAEYILPENLYHEAQVSEKTGKVSFPQPAGYRQVIVGHQLREFVRRGSWDAALQLAKQHKWVARECLALMWATRNRMHGRKSDASLKFKIFQKDLEAETAAQTPAMEAVLAFCSAYRKNLVWEVSEDIQLPWQYVGQNNLLFELNELLETAEFAYANSHEERGLLALHQFCERLVNGSLLFCTPFKLIPEHLAKENIYKLDSWFEQTELPGSLKDFFSKNGISPVNKGLMRNMVLARWALQQMLDGQPLLFAQKPAAAGTPEVWHQLAQTLERIWPLFAPNNGVFIKAANHLGRFRNELAHNGKLITKRKLEESLPAFDQLFPHLRHYLGLPASSGYTCLQNAQLELLTLRFLPSETSIEN